MGSDTVLFIFKDPEFMSSFIDSSSLSDWFSNINPWNENGFKEHKADMENSPNEDVSSSSRRASISNEFGLSNAYQEDGIKGAQSDDASKNVDFSNTIVDGCCAFELQMLPLRPIPLVQVSTLNIEEFESTQMLPAFPPPCDDIFISVMNPSRPCSPSGLIFVDLVRTSSLTSLRLLSEPEENDEKESPSINSNLPLSHFKASRLVKQRSKARRHLIDILDLYPKLRHGGKVRSKELFKKSFIASDSEIKRMNNILREALLTHLFVPLESEITNVDVSLLPEAEAALTIQDGKEFGFIYEGDESLLVKHLTHGINNDISLCEQEN
ncbi:hypothetical protein GH714_007339 [Hevea brasiliensis]|uniref:Uncharacterized protein n=1 Tax=Hevea brasiliensis TaxID=3981 RepID=A0A6A6LXE1_HEVBR|nr:hypothetical protein GH714_007339 [Hevea brasiliensis]